MRILVLDGSSGGGRIALVRHGTGGMDCLHGAEAPGGGERLAGMLRGLLEAAGWEAASLGLIAVVIGPGSFTGLRATLALAHGVALGAGVALGGATTGEALRRTVPCGAAPLWCVGLARRDRVFLDRDDPGGPRAFMLDALPLPDRPVLLAGDASSLVASGLARLGAVACLSGFERPDAAAIASVARDRLEGRLAPRATLPLYVDPPEARLPATGLRPPPA